MSILRIPMAEALTWPHLMRPAAALLYLDLNHFIYLARADRDGDSGPAGYADLLASATAAVTDGRLVVPLSSEHVYEMQRIADPAQRNAVAAVMERLSGFHYLPGRPTLAELEVEAGIEAIFGEARHPVSLPLVRRTFAHAYGMVGGFKITDGDGNDTRDDVRADVGPDRFDSMMAAAQLLLERSILAGPSDEDAAILRQSHGYAPESVLAGQDSRLAFERETSSVLDANPRWRKGRLRDLIAGREFVHEWLDLFNRVMRQRVEDGRTAFDPGDPEMRRLLAGLPHVQVAVSLKTQLHRNPSHDWTVNDIADIDALSVGYAYCDAVFTDKAVRHALSTASELKVIPTFLPRTPSELVAWINSLPVPSLGPEFVIGVARTRRS